MKFRFFSIYCILLFAAGLLAQSIHIIDFWTESPLSDALVISDGDTLFSNKQGYVDLGLFTAAPQTISLQKEGYYSRSIDLNATRSRIIKLMPIQSSADIEVVSQRPGDAAIMTPTHTTFLPAVELRQSGITSLDKALETQSGVFIKSYGPAGQMQSISIRGMAAEQTQLFIDGIPVNSMQTGGVDPGQYNLQQLERVEIYRGGNALFGGAGTIGGAINLKSRPIPDSLHYALQLRGESLQNKFADVMLGVPTGALKNDLSVHLGEGDNNYTVQDGSEEVSLGNRDFKRWHIRYRSRLSLSEKFNIKALLYTYKFKGGSPASYKNAAAEDINNARISYDNNLVSLNLNYQEKYYNLNLRAFIRNDWNDYLDPDSIIAGNILASNHFNHEFGIIGSGQIILIDDLLLNAGVESANQKVNSTNSGINTRDRYALFLKGEYEWPRAILDIWKAQLYGSLRAESWSDFGNIILPGAGITFLSPYIKIYASIGRNYRAPTFNELYWHPGGNPELQPEESFNTEAGFQFDIPFRGFALNLNTAIYRSQVKNQVRWLPVTADIWSPQNILQVRSRGIEVSAEISAGSRMHRLSGNYRYGTSEKTAAEFKGDPTVGNRLPYLPAETWMVALHSGISELSGGIQLSSTSFRYTTFSNDPYNIIPSYMLARCWAGFPVHIAGQHLRINGGIENLFDKQYQVMPGYPMPGRQFYLELKLTN